MYFIIIVFLNLYFLLIVVSNYGIHEMYRINQIDEIIRLNHEKYI